ncbi:Resistance-Nodulation-Cell Division Superfamily transporter [Sulfurimonas denitrificans DSM 1251]|uniref:Resistance-Nodulation-Cell Division Superfamily transporter n=1 Tax=Sulfurimonas denitrificans (strain ATCC 33889 / DSM 1251) TaxID=326298 RepID=Q30NZ6_SULDN|nr:CusA/CzcA family heavy metal efflux RND transporter [Sulfurimonas denitrificans]ABB45285.1 Resistance-Nodulation-Cell Division Superfamily transporter [Sulfurimonas denitrificans DSM 1251]
MSEKLINFVLSQRFLTLLVAMAVFIFGASSMLKLPVDAYPDVAPTQVKIILKSSGMTPAEMESRVMIPVEQNLQSIPKQLIVRSLAKYGICDITIDFEDGVDIYWARQQVAQRLSEVKDTLPENVSGGLAPITTPLGEVLMFTIESDTLDLMQKRTLLDWVINKRIRSIDGVADTNALGGYVKTYEVTPDFAKMKLYKITVDMLQSALSKNNKNEGVGRLSIGEQSLFIRTEGRLKNLEDISTLIIKNEDARDVRISDIAEVNIGSLTRGGFVTKDGKEEAVEGLILSRKGVDTSGVLKRVKAELKSIEKELPKGTTINIFYDRSDLVSKAINTVTKALLEAMALIIIVLYLFLGSFASAFSVAIILPFAAMMTFIAMSYFGISANLMSLGGLAIAIGMLVDAGVVMVENIAEHLHDEKYKDDSKLSVVMSSAKEVATPVFTGILIIIIVFLPLLTLEGLEGKLFVPVALSIVFALTSSLILALTFIPVVSFYVLKKAPQKPVALMVFLEKRYEKILRFSLSHQNSLFVAVGILWIAAVVAYVGVGKTFMPSLDEGNVIIGIEKNPSISLEASRDIDLKIQQAIMREVPEVLSIVARGGSDEIGLDPMGLNDTDTFLVLKPKDEWRVPSNEWLLDEFRRILDEFVGIEYSFTQPIAMRVSEMLSGSRGDIVVNIYGGDTGKLEEIAKEVVKITESIKGSSDVYKKANEGVAYWEIEFKDEAMARLGVNKDELSNYLKASVDGIEVGIIQEDLRRIPLMIKGDKILQTSMSENMNLQYVLGSGQSVEINELVEFKMTQGPVQIDHENTMRKSLVQTNVVGRDLVGFVNELSSLIDTKLQLPQGYFVEYAGEYQNQQRASKRLSVVIPLSIVLVFILLFVTFNSSLQAFLVLLNIPFALIGGIYGLYYTGEYMSVPASVGFIALMGIAVLNGVVMLEYFNKLQGSVEDSKELVIQGSLRRLRPVLMTAFIAALGLIPMLFATGPGSEIQKPLAIVVINGLVSSTFLTLVLLPILYHKFVAKKL